MKLGVFLQVRLGSTRLPSKALLPLEGRSVIEHAMEALRVVDADVHAILTDGESLSSLEPVAGACGFEAFAGPEEDVLRRFALAVKHFGVDTYIRATGDNPLVSGPLAEDLLRYHIHNRADFSGYLGPPLGTGVEITKAAAILIADDEAVDPYEREHVSPFIYRRPGRFTVRQPWAPDEVCLPESKVTLDTRADYKVLQEIYRSLYRGKPIETQTLVAWLKDHGKLHETKSPDNPVCSIDKER